MTVLNSASEGLPNELIVLARACFEAGPILREELVELCEMDGQTRLRGCLSKWTALGLFVLHDDKVEISSEVKGAGEGVDAWTERLPSFCRTLVFKRENYQPLFGEDAGTSADLVKGLAWLLAQDIFALPDSWDGVGKLEVEQLEDAHKIFSNDVRFNAFRYWARFLGFANNNRGFFLDSANAVREEVRAILKSSEFMSADGLVSELSKRIPVFDGGVVRDEMIGKINPGTQSKLKPRQLSIALSHALQRLEMEQVIAFDSPSDTESGFMLLGSQMRERRSLIRVRLL